ncbi:MAG: putative transposase, partial [Candidatus Deferrimicrobiota bacterium]
MVCLVQSGYADQNDVAWAFGITPRMLRKYQRRYEIGGIAALGRTSGRPPGIQAEPSPWVRTAVVMKGNGYSVRDIAQRLNVSIGAVSKWLTRQSKSIIPHSQTMLVSSSPDTSHNGKEALPTSSTMHEEVEGLSLDSDPANRALDRILARLGKLDDAQPIFNPGKRISRAGVLLAVPALVQSGIFSAAQEIYGSIGPSFYGLRTTMLSLLLLALLRIKRPEGLKEHVPADLGRLLGLDRAPEVKTLR